MVGAAAVAMVAALGGMAVPVGREDGVVVGAAEAALEARVVSPSIPSRCLHFHLRRR